jgi:hypothetical protein
VSKRWATLIIRRRLYLKAKVLQRLLSLISALVRRLFNNGISYAAVIQHRIKGKNERGGHVVATRALYLGGPGFESRTRDRLSRVTCSVSRGNKPVQHLKVGQNRLISVRFEVLTAASMNMTAIWD